MYNRAMTPTDSVNNTSNSFIQLFSPKRDEKFILWNNKDTVGLSLLKQYTDKGLYCPAKTVDGTHDSVALIRIGYYVSEIKDGVVPIIVNINHTSKYLMDNHWNYDFNDSRSPTKESLERSKSSRQPIDLEDTSRYFYNINKNKIFDTEKQKFVTARFLVNDIYRKHLDTLTNLTFRLKIASRHGIVESIPHVTGLMEKINLKLFGRTIRDSKDFAVGIFKPYPYSDLVSLSPDRINILGTDLPITNQTARTFVIFWLLLYLLKTYTKFDLLGLVGLIEGVTSGFFLTIIVSAFLVFFDYVLPLVILYLENCLIKLKLYLMLRVKIKI
ncbi:hypothetical protein A2368_01905 [Candidatus Collierbacteria bacterium RIFOXYB1_FULL_49_13]|uniref:Uncharacterized protein n=1 Tax=Candidatus Collierbacteria bacterium RIFOXYB1_FULL_49_13 TaxID=1817728 RepID=A0A1F5FG44_9BACT|nr:MAG: hypothetical protein A2368_01905 [Candidatus Collierbacteria bacterium RIFOXYB1_FULL_49_13]